MLQLYSVSPITRGVKHGLVGKWHERAILGQSPLEGALRRLCRIEFLGELVGNGVWSSLMRARPSWRVKLTCVYHARD